MKITIEEIAEKAGVSITTVSRVLNEKKGVAAKTRAKVLQIIKENDYLPTFSAQTLASRKTNTIGIVILQSPKYIFSNPHAMEVLRGITETLTRYNYYFLLLLLNKEQRYTQFFKEKRVDGLIFFITRHQDHYLQELIESHYPFVTVGRPTGFDQISYVDSNALRGVYIGAEHLIQLGHRKIGYFGASLEYSTGYYRFEGFRMAIEEYKLPYHEEWVIFAEDCLQENGRQQAEQLLKSKNLPTAILCFNDALAVGAMDVFRKAGLRIPEDISIIGYDSSYLAEYANPPLTSLAQSGYEQAAKAAEVLLQNLNHETKESTQIIFPVNLVIRQSTGAPPSENDFGSKREVETE